LVVIYHFFALGTLTHWHNMLDRFKFNVTVKLKSNKFEK